MDSRTPLCAGLQEVWNVDVWGDDRGVFALVTGMGPGLSELTPEDDAGVAMVGDQEPMPTAGAFADPAFDFAGAPQMVAVDGDYQARTRVWHNEGQGWLRRAEAFGAIAQSGLTGLERKELLVHGQANPQVGEYGCQLGTIAGKELSCFDVDGIQDVVAVDGTLAYALMGGTRVLRYEEGRWHSNPNLLPYPASVLWADANDLFAFGSGGTVLRFEDDEWSLIDAATLDGMTAAWGTSANDLWVGTSTGLLLHYDGTSFVQKAELGGQSCTLRQPVNHIWGTGDVVYVSTPTQLARWNGSELESLGNWTCDVLGGGQQIRGLWGRSESEVYVAVMEQSVGNPCGFAFLAQYDGDAFHRF